MGDNTEQRPVPKKDGEPRIAFEGVMFEVVHYPMKIGQKSVTFEHACRAPGVRLIIEKDEKFLLSKEYRSEIEDYDYRLAGGKVFDTREEYQTYRNAGKDMQQAAEAAAEKECSEETGLRAQSVEFFALAHAGASVEWNLYYFVIKDFEEGGAQALEDGEDITTGWFSRDEIDSLIKDGKMREDRSIGVLYRYFLSKQ